MSFLTDLFEGKTSNLGNDLSPSNVFSDTQKDIGGKNTLAELLGGAALATGGLGLAGAFGAGGAAAAGTAAADTGFDLATIGPGVADAGAGLGVADAASGGLDLASLGFATDASGSLAGAPGVAAIDAAAPLGATTGAADAAGGSLAGGLPDVATTVGGSTAGSDVAGGSQSFLDKLISGASTSLTKNPLGIAAAAGGLGLSFLRGNQTDPNVKQLEAQAPGLQAQGAALTASGQQLQTYLTSGTLPSGLQAQVTNAVQAEKARIIQNHASNGENTNPAQNSALAQELSQADMNGLALAGQYENQLAATGQQLISTGINETGLSTQLYESLAKIDETNNATLMSAIASMAAALGGGTKIQIGGTAAA